MSNTKIGIKSQGVMRLDWLAAIARDAALPCMAVRLAVLILRYVDNKTGIARAKQDKLAADCGVSIDTVRRGLAALGEAGHLVRLSIGRPGHTSLYQLKSAAAQASNSASQTDCVGGKSASHRLAELQGTALQDCGPFSVTNSDIVSDMSLSSKTDDESGGRDDLFFEESKPKETIGQEITLTPARKSSRADSYAAADDAFASFWAIYPRREAKGDALKAFRAAVNAGAEPSDIIRGASAYASLRAAEPDPVARLRFTQKPGGWLRAERWTDEMPPAGALVIDAMTGETVRLSEPVRPQPQRSSANLYAFADAYTNVMGG